MKNNLTTFQTELIDSLNEWSKKEIQPIQVKKENPVEVVILVGDLVINLYEAQAEISGPDLYRRFENWNEQKQSNIIKEIVRNVSFYIKNPAERDVISLKRPDLLLRRILSRMGIHLNRNIKE